MKFLKAFLFLTPFSAYAQTSKGELDYKKGFVCTFSDDHSDLGYNFGPFSDGISVVEVNPRVVNHMQVTFYDFTMKVETSDFGEISFVEILSEKDPEMENLAFWSAFLDTPQELTAVQQKLTINWKFYETVTKNDGTVIYQTTGQFHTQLLGHEVVLDVQCTFLPKSK